MWLSVHAHRTLYRILVLVFFGRLYFEVYQKKDKWTFPEQPTNYLNKQYFFIESVVQLLGIQFYIYTDTSITLNLNIHCTAFIWITATTFATELFYKNNHVTILTLKHSKEYKFMFLLPSNQNIIKSIRNYYSINQRN